MASQGLGPRTLIARVALSLSGHLRPRPDHAAEAALRAAFTELDKELAAVLGDPPPVIPRPRRNVRPTASRRLAFTRRKPAGQAAA